MFPFRRGGGKKRGKGGPGGPGGGGGGSMAPGGGGGPRYQQQQRDGRRGVPGSAGELLSALQPTTKALAQMLAGNARSSGQIAHARNVLSQAQRLVEERQVDRMPPAHREEFLEQLARLKLTLADADEAGLLDEAEPEAEPRPAAASLTPEQLRDVARRLAMSETPAPTAPPSPPTVSRTAWDEPDEEEAALAEADAASRAAARAEAEAAAAAPHARGERLRLRVASASDAAAPVRARDRLRLRPLKPASGGSRD